MLASLLQDAGRAGVFHLPPGARHALKTALAGHLRLIESDLGDCRNIEQVLSRFGRDFAFPSWYGANLDALHDCLTDADWQPEQGIVLLIAGLATLHQNDLAAANPLIEVLRAAAEERSADGQPLWILLTDPMRGVADLPVA